MSVQEQGGQTTQQLQQRECDYVGMVQEGSYDISMAICHRVMALSPGTVISDCSAIPILAVLQELMEYDLG